MTPEDILRYKKMLAKEKALVEEAAEAVDTAWNIISSLINAKNGTESEVSDELEEIYDKLWELTTLLPNLMDKTEQGGSTDA